MELKKQIKKYSILKIILFGNNILKTNNLYITILFAPK